MKYSKFAIAAVIVSALSAAPAHAYVDGGTTLLLLQGFFGALGAAVVFLKSPWQMAVRIFSRKKQKKEKE